MKHFRKTILTAAAFASLSWAAPAAAKPIEFQFDHAHTNLLFFVSHVGFSNMVGEFRDYEGHFIFDEKNPEKSSVELTMKVSGIETDSDGLNKHLQSPDFFDAEKYPEIKFVSTKVVVTGDNVGEVEGNLTMHGVTKPVVLDVTFNKQGEHPMTHNLVAGFTAKAVIKRSDFGMTYGLPGIIGDAVQLHAELEGTNALQTIEGKK